MRRAGWVLFWVSAAAICAPMEHAGAQATPAFPPLPGEQAESAPALTVAPPLPSSASPASAEAAFEALDLRGRVAQCILMTLQGQQRPAADEAGVLERYALGGVVVRRVLGGPGGAVDYAGRVRALAAGRGLPLLIGADLFSLAAREHGATSAFVQLPSLLSVAASGDPEDAARFGRLVGGLLGNMGFNFCLGPSLALAPELSGAQGTIHLIGADARRAAIIAEAVQSELSRLGLLMLPLDFPGGAHNRAREGAPPVLLTPEPLLMEHDLLPYRRAIASGAKLLHAGNILVPALDSAKAASLSAPVLRSLLREKLGFEGVIVAGPMDGAELTHYLDPAAAACQALEAGADLLLFEGQSGQAVRVIEKLVAAVQSGDLSESVVNAAARRVLALKYEALRPQELKSEAQVTRLAERKDLTHEVATIERHSLTLLKNSNGVLPLRRDKSLPAGLTGVVALEGMRGMLEKELKELAMQEVATARHLGEIQDFEIERLTSRVRGVRTVICVFTAGLRPAGPVELVRRLKENGVSVVVVLLGYPSYAAQLDAADAIVLAYCDAATHETTLKAVAELLLGRSALRVLSAEEMLGPGRSLTMRVGESLRFDALRAVQAPAGRLPLRLSEAFPEGSAARMDPALSLKRAQWDFGGKKVGKTTAEYAFASAGTHRITLTVTDTSGETRSGSFEVQVRE